MGRAAVLLWLTTMAGCNWVYMRAAGVHEPRVMQAAQLDKRAATWGIKTTLQADQTLARRLLAEGIPSAVVFDRNHQRILVHEKGTCSQEAYPLIQRLSSDTQVLAVDHDPVRFDEVSEGLRTFDHKTAAISRAACPTPRSSTKRSPTTPRPPSRS